ncbi:unnamed protein product, partial [Rotaria sp. Silwood2]
MSLATFESLPNEILIDIFEKYINGIDLLVAFAYQLNSRIDALIGQCQNLHFDFTSIHKNDFRFCIGLLPAYIDRIEDLTLSEQDAPGQMHAFFSFLPLFNQFKRLRKLNLQIDSDALNWRQTVATFHSLPNTLIHTISIKLVNFTIEQQLTILNIVLSTKILKRIVLDFEINTQKNPWIFPFVASNILHLTINDLYSEP